MRVLYAIPIFYYMAEQTVEQSTSVMWATSTPPTKYTQEPTLFPGTPKFRQSPKMDWKCQTRPTIISLRPRFFLSLINLEKPVIRAFNCSLTIVMLWKIRFSHLFPYIIERKSKKFDVNSGSSTENPNRPP